MARKNEATDFGQQVDAIVKRIVDAVDADANCWNAEFKVAKLKHEWSKWIATDPGGEEAVVVTSKLNIEFGNDDTGPVLSLVEWREDNEQRREDLIDQQERLCDEIDEAKARHESANEQVKAAKARVDECHSRLRSVARELRKPFVYTLPQAPDRQRSFIDDGEEWRLVKLADVLNDNAALKAVALQKLGDITLGEFAEEAAKWATVDKPKKLTRKQWDDIGEIVQEWHAQQGTDDDAGDEADE